MLAANDVASVIIARSGRWLDAKSLQKLLYYVQAWHLAIRDEPLFAEKIKAWRDGPVVPQVWHERKNSDSRRTAGQILDGIMLDEETADLIDLVLGNYGSMSGDELSALTHVEQPWQEARGDLPPEADCREPLSLESMATFYREHRMLGGRSAADLASGGLYLRARDASGPLDVDALLRSLPDDSDDDYSDPWGSANLEPADHYNRSGIDLEWHRAYRSA